MKALRTLNLIVVLLTLLAPWPLQAQAATQTDKISNPTQATAPPPTQVASRLTGVADWPAPRQDSGRTHHNEGEIKLQPPLPSAPDRSIDLGETFAASGPAIVADDFIYVVNGASLRALDPSGQELWRFEAPELGLILTPPTVSGDKVLLVYSDFTLPSKQTETLIALYSGSGDTAWTHRIHWKNFVVQDERVYLLWEDEVDLSSPDADYLSALRLSDGQELWRQPVDFYEGYTGQPAVAGNRLFFTDGDDVVAHSLTDGQEVWRFTDEQNTSTVDVDLAASGDVVLVSQAQRVFALDAASGAQRWYDEPGPDTCWADDTVVGTDGYTAILFGLCREEIVAYDLTTGASRWRTSVADGYFVYLNFAIANGVLYAGSYENDTSKILALDMADGSLLQAIPLDHLPGYLSVANGQLFALSGVPPVLEIWGEDPDSSLYLRRYDEDENPLTNPTGGTPLPLSDRDGDYGALVGIAARIGGDPATLRVYHDDETLYKSAQSVPDRFGVGYWVVPLEYAAGGYLYEVELSDGTVLPRRTISMPADPAANVAAVHDLDGLVWQSPPATPATIDQLPATLRLTLPSDFPGGATEALLVLQAGPQDGRERVGALTVAGERAGDAVEFQLTRDNVARGSYTAAALAQAGNVTAYSADHALNIDVPGLANTLISHVTALGRTADGEISQVTYRFQRQRPANIDANAPDVQVANVIPDPAGYLVRLRVDMPAGGTTGGQWEIALQGRDAAGNLIARRTLLLSTGSDGTTYVLAGLKQPGATPIQTIETAQRFVGLTVSVGPSRVPLQPAGDWGITDVIDVTAQGGVGGSGALGVGATGSAYYQESLLTGDATACIEGGFRAGEELSAGPQTAVNLGLNLRGPSHDAPASGGTKVDLTFALGVGVQVSYTAPDNFGDGGYGQVGLGVSFAPQQKLSGGLSRVECLPPDPEEEPNEDPPPECQDGSCDAPPPPGGDHPDDTHSVVLYNTLAATDPTRNRWVNLSRLARGNGFDELAEYAVYQARLAEYVTQIADLPVGETLSEAQADLVSAYRYYRIRSAAQLATQRATILSQWRLLRNTHVLMNGYYEEMMAMLNAYNLPARLVRPDFSPDALGSSLLVIPTGGLYGLGDVPAFRDRLERFVAGGGTLLVMAQPEDNALSALPGSGLTQVGYQNDISCFLDAMTALTAHPMLASLTSAEVTAHVDGYLTGLPAGATELLKRTKNDQGAFALYTYGQGQVIVTNMYDDWGRTVGQSSPQVRALFRDVARWAMMPEDLPDTRPGGTVTVPLDVTNYANRTAAQVRYVVRDPNGQEVTISPEGQSVALAPGQSTTLNPTFAPGDAPLGVWQLTYELRDDDDTIVQEETWGALFTVSDPPVRAATTADTNPAPAIVASPPPSATVSADLDQDAYAGGETVGLTLGVTLPDPGAVSGLQVIVALGATTQEQTVTAQASQQIDFDLLADFSGNGLLFYGVYDSGSGQGLYLDTLWVPQAGQTVTVLPERPRYAPGETVTLTIQSTLSRTLYLQGPGLAQTLAVQPGNTSFSFDLPVPLASGPYAVTYQDQGQTRAARFDVKGPTVVIAALETAQPQADVDQSVTVTATLQGDAAVDVYLLGDLVEPEGDSRRVIEQSYTLQKGIQTVTLTVPFSVATAGLARLDLSIVDATDPSVEYQRAARQIATDAPELMALRTQAATLRTDQAVTLQLDWYSPKADTVDVTLELDGTPVTSATVTLAPGFTTTALALPSALEQGTTIAHAAATVDGLTTRASTALVVEFRDMVYLPLVIR